MFSTLPCHKYCNIRNNEWILRCRLVCVMMFLWSNHWKMTNYLKLNERIAYPLSFQRQWERSSDAGAPKAHGGKIQHNHFFVILGVGWFNWHWYRNLVSHFLWNSVKGLQTVSTIRNANMPQRNGRRKKTTAREDSTFKTKLAYPEQI